MRIGACDHHLTCFNRLAQCLENCARKLWKLVHEQDTVMGERYLAGLCAATAAHDGGH